MLVRPLWLCEFSSELSYLHGADLVGCYWWLVVVSSFVSGKKRANAGYVVRIFCAHGTFSTEGSTVSKLAHPFLDEQGVRWSLPSQELFEDTHARLLHEYKQHGLSIWQVRMPVLSKNWVQNDILHSIMVSNPSSGLDTFGLVRTRHNHV